MEAIETLSQFMKEQLAKLPVLTDEQKEQFNWVNNHRAESAFIKRLEEKLVPVIEKLAERDRGGDFELGVLTMASLWFQDPTNSGGPMTNGGTSLERMCQTRLVENHIDNEFAQDTLFRLTNEISRGFSERDMAPWKEIRDKSPFASTRAVASLHIFPKVFSEALPKCNKTKYDEAQFDSHFKKLERCVSDLTSENVEMSPQHENLLSFRADSIIRQTEMWLQAAKSTSPAIEPSRIERIIELTKPLTVKP
jgi:hypothetical protein